MAAVGFNTSIGSSFDRDAAKAIVFQTMKNEVITKMAQAIFRAGQQGQGYTKVAEIHTVDWENQIEASDKKVQEIFTKLFLKSMEFIQTDAFGRMMLDQFAKIDEFTGVENASGKFLGSFVFNALNPMINRLDTEQPGATDHLSEW